MVRRWLAIAVLTAACAHRPAVSCAEPRWQDLARDPVAPALVGTVELAGPSRAALELRRMSWLAGTPFEPARVDRMARMIERSFVRDGYADARIVVRERPVHGAVDVCVAASAGPRVVIGSIRFPGSSGVAVGWLLRAIADKDGFDTVGGLYDVDKLDASLSTLAAVFYDDGYAAVKIDPPRSRRVGDSLDIEVPIQQGNRFKLGVVAVTSELGALEIPLSLVAGSWFSRAKLIEERDRVAKLTGGAVAPNIALDYDHAVLTIELSIVWEWPWDALRALPLLSSR